MAYSKIILNSETLMDVTNDTVDAEDLLSGETATKNDGTKVTGSIATKSAANLTANGSTVTVPMGYYSTTATKNVDSVTHPNPTAAIASSTGVVTATHTQSAGYVTSGTATGTLNLTTKAAATIYPSTADQTISSYRWITGAQTIKSVTTSNLTAANIASGVTVKVGDSNNASRISQITGTYEPTTSNLTVIPTETTQTFNATGVYGYKPVTVNGISSTYVGTGVSLVKQGDLTKSGYNVFAPSGYYSSQIFYNLSHYTHNNPTIYIASSTGIITAAHNQEDAITNMAVLDGENNTYSTYSLLSLATQTIYPSTADQTISSYRWLTGAQTIKSVTTSNLSAENIAEGVTVQVGDSNNASRIAQVIGTHSGGGGSGYTADEIAMRTISGDISGNATTIGAYAFYNCYSLTTISFPLCTTIGSSAFQHCSSLTTISFPSCTIISAYAFRSCSSLTTISFPSCTIISNYAFYNCYSLTTISFPLCTTIGNYVFFNCVRLTTISFPSCTTIGSSAFYGCSSLTTMSFPSCTAIGSSAFAYCFRLLSLYLLGSSVPTLSGSFAFISTPIDGYTTKTDGVYGSIFVPSSLYDSYITATNWSLVSSRIVSV